MHSRPTISVYYKNRFYTEMMNEKTIFHAKTPLASVCALVGVLFISYHLISQRINHADFPGGDQGSWMSVAAQLSRGEGFTTRWLEHPFLRPLTLPRPDDFRYPGLALPLACSFAVFGVSYKTALWTVAVVFFIFLLVLFLVCRQAFNGKTAIVAVAVTAVSLLQLQWNSIVYSEGMFGVAVGLLLLWLLVFPDTNRKLFWVILGAGCGLLYCIRPNGILFGAGMAWLFLTERKKGRPAGLLLLGLASMALCMLPWLVWTWYCFGNPFHIATNAGLLRGSASDTVNLTITEFWSRYGPLLPVKAVFSGAVQFFKTLHFFEHGLEVIPLAGVAAGLLQRRRLYSPFASAGFLLTFLACCYASSIGGSWAGVRYFSSLLPFLYGYGIHTLLSVMNAWAIRLHRLAPYAVTGLFACFLLAPVYFPHKYYERHYRSQEPSDLVFVEHKETMQSLLAPHGTYFAASVAQLNFLFEYNCVGLQQFFDSTYVNEAIGRFSPTLLVVTRKEYQEPRIAAIIREIRRCGREVSPVACNKYGLYFRIR